MNWRKALAKLNPRSPSIVLGSGGVPEFSAQDIAAALGMVRNALGREILCLVWWPDGASLTRRQLRAMAIDALIREHNRRSSELSTATLERLAAEVRWAGQRAHTEPDLRELQRARARRFEAKRNAWPSVPEVYPLIVDAVLREISTPSLCPKCHGTGHVVDSAGVQRMCVVCDGHGVTPVSDRTRAEMIGRDPANYSRTWAPVYEWTLRQLRDAESEAGRQLAAALSSEWAA